MHEPTGGNTPAARIKKVLDELFVKFKKTPYTIPVAIAITVLIFYLMMAYIPGSCWIGLIPPLLLFGLLWQFEVRRVRKLLLYGLICALAVMVVATVFLVSSFQSLEMETAQSAGADPVLVNGVVDPTTGGKTTLFTFNITVRLNEPGVNVTDVKVNITSLTYTRNETMAMVGGNASLNETYYEYVTTLSEPINQFHFVALVNDTWVRAGDYIDDRFIPIVGPVFSDPWAVAVPVLQYVTLYQAFLQFFPIYAILSGMVWWMRRARRMREDAVKRWEEKRKEMEAKVPEDKKKIATTASTSDTPSLERAMGLTPEPDTFVCSDCGADVPGDAKSCPVCGEKFE